MKKFSAILLVVIMLMAMTATTFADGEATLTDGTVVDKTDGVSNTLKIEKSLVFKNPTEDSVYGPNITYTYTIEPGSAEKDITDTDSIHAKTFAGLDNATISGTVAWNSNTKYTASATGAADVKTFNIEFDESAFTSAGVYRYVITEAVNPATKADAGVTEGEISDTRYLDVYVKNGNTSGTFEIYGYALFSNDNSINATATTGSDTVAKAGKTTGFVAGDEDGSGTVKTADTYQTINLIVSKTLNGDAGMNNHPFPFTVGITNSDIKTAVKLITKTGTLADVEAGSGTEGAAIAIAAASDGMTTTDTSHSIKNEDAVKYIGIPALSSATYTVKEKNDVVGTTYESSYIVDSGSKSGVKNIEYNAESETASVTANDDADHKVVFTNELKLISPTGLTLRIAPYALMLAGGIVLLLISRRKAKAEE